MFGTISTFVTLIASVLETRLGHTNGDVLELIKFAGALIGEGDDAREDFEELTARVKQMQEDGLGLSAAEIAGIRETRLRLSSDISEIREKRDQEAREAEVDPEALFAAISESEDRVHLQDVIDNDENKALVKAAKQRLKALERVSTN